MIDERESMSAAEFMRKSLEALNKRMEYIERTIEETKSVIANQNPQIKSEIKGVVKKFVKEYVQPHLREQEMN